MWKRLLFTAPMGLALGGCFTSTTPLIAPHEAAFPIATPATVGALRADGTADPLRLERRAGAYQLIDPNAKNDGKPAEALKYHFILRAIGEGVYLAQNYADGGEATCPCTYGAVVLKGGRVDLHLFEDYGTSLQLSAEELSAYGIALDENNYRLSSFDKAAALFRKLLERPRPDKVYDVKAP